MDRVRLMPDYRVLPDAGAAAALIGDPVRSRMLLALLDGGERSASELASHGGASRQSASGHLAKLVEGGLLRVRVQGRGRLFRLSSPEVAHAMEILAALAPERSVTSLHQHALMERLRQARTCYDHLAGRLGVSVTEALRRERAIELNGGGLRMTPKGERLFASLGVDLAEVRAQRRQFARVCLDWTERRHHLAGGLGAALLQAFLERGWVVRNARDRSLRISCEGEAELERLFGLRLQGISGRPA